jgi:hypothetical protein
MNRIANLNPDQRKELFMETAVKKGIGPAVVEKDFWVCWVLKYLFSIDEIKSKIVFKGGTTLSKVFGVIERFSEDIDLILDWKLLGYGEGGQDPYHKHPSKTQQDRFNKEVNRAGVEYIKKILFPILQKLSVHCPKVSINIDSKDHHCVNVVYPAAFSESYIRPQVVLEIGPLAAWIPSKKYRVKSYAAEVFPQIFEESECDVFAITGERTFWEKATILHQEAHRSGLVKSRYSRHYYDLCRLSNSEIKQQAFNSMNLLEEVREFKKRFYPCSWANYDDAKPGSLKLMPTSINIPELKKDYKSMQVMIFGEKPSFDNILDTLQDLENEINSIRQID